MKIKHSIIIVLFLLASFLRLYQLGTIPPGFDWDEASIGYNAWSVLKTGKDEYGNLFPLSFRSFGDYKPPVYFYFTVPSIAIFGLNEFAIRLPSALSGIFAVLAVFYLVETLFKNHQYKFRLAAVSAFLLCISPWHLQFSRLAFEANLALTFTILGVLFFLKSETKSKYIYFSAVSFVLATYSYHSEKFFVPLLIIILIIIYKQFIPRYKHHYYFAALIMLLLELPFLLSLFLGSGGERFNGVSIFPHQTEILKRDLIKISEDKKSGLILPNLIHNYRFTFFNKIIEGYLSSFNLNWLFIKGDQERHHAPGVGLLYLLEMPLLLYGIYSIFFQEKRVRNLLFFWILLTPLPSAPTIDLPHAVRTLTFLPALQIVSAYGLINLISKAKYFKKTYKIIYYLYFFLFSLNIFYYFHQYYIHLPVDYAKYFQYGYKELVLKTKNEYNNYEKFIVSEKLEQPYIFFLFYLKYDPLKYLAEGGTDTGEIKRFGKFEFRTINEEKEKFDGKTLFIGTPGELSHNYTSLYYPDGTEMSRIVRK